MVGHFELVFAPFSGLIFFLGLFAFIIQYKQVEKLLFIIALGGFLLLLEQLIKQLIKLQLNHIQRVVLYQKYKVFKLILLKERVLMF